MNKDEVMLAYAELNNTLQQANEDLAEFLLKNKLTRGRQYRNQIRLLRNQCKKAIQLSLEYEKHLRIQKKDK